MFSYIAHKGKNKQRELRQNKSQQMKQTTGQILE
jgi:hypothetical protein